MILVPKHIFDLGVMGDGLILSLLLLFRKKKTIPQTTIPKHVGLYLVIASFLTLFITRAFVFIDSLEIWGEAVGLCATTFVIGYLVEVDHHE